MAAITEVGELYSQLNAPDDAADAWPFPGLAFADFNKGLVDKEIGWALIPQTQGANLQAKSDEPVPIPIDAKLSFWNSKLTMTQSRKAGFASPIVNLHIR
jgi:hypothetical protein